MYQDDYGVTECFENQFGYNNVKSDLNTKNIITKTMKPVASHKARLQQKIRNQTIRELSSQYTRDPPSKEKLKKKNRIF